MSNPEQNQLVREVRMKRMMSDRRDCVIKWQADFSTMVLSLHVDFLAPALLVDFLARLPHSDDRFQRTGITDVIQICDRFTVVVRVMHGKKESCYRLRLYRPEMTNDPRAQLEAEFTPMDGAET